MRLFFIIALFLILTVSSMAKTTGRLRLRGTIPFATQITLQPQQNDILLTIVSNAQQASPLQIIINQNGQQTTHYPDFLFSKSFSALIKHSQKNSAHPIFLTLRAL